MPLSIKIEMQLWSSRGSSFSIPLPRLLLCDRNLELRLSYRRYRNQEALVKHSQTPYYQAFMAKAGVLMAKPLEIQRGGGPLPESTKVSRL